MRVPPALLSNIKSSSELHFRFKRCSGHLLLNQRAEISTGYRRKKKRRTVNHGFEAIFFPQVFLAYLFKKKKHK